MPSLLPNIENRVRKLTKPATYTQGLLPVFEAVSNAIHAIDDRYGDNAKNHGLVVVDVENMNDEHKIRIMISDNGIGLTNDRFVAFCTVDTDFKIARGGKGVGRLFWLDAFNSIKIESAFKADGKLAARAFSFELKNDDQIIEDVNGPGIPLPDQGTIVTFAGLRTPAYREHFPKGADTLLRHFSAHFIADFLVGIGPKVKVIIDGMTTEYPKAISDLVVGEAMETGPFELAGFGKFSIKLFTTVPEASTGLDGNHQIHLLGDGRTVETRKIDGLVGLKGITRGENHGLFLHACVSSEYLDGRVNEGRTAFNIPEILLKDLTRRCVEEVKGKLLIDQMAAYNAIRVANIENFIARHPIYGFEDTTTLLGKVSFSATSSEDFATGLVKYQIRRDEGRQVAMESIIRKLEGSENVPENFAETVIEAAENLQAAERLSLAQHVVRRKLVLDLMGKLVARIRVRGDKPDDYHLEKTLHSLLCPVNVRGDEPLNAQSRSHDLWIVDERLAFTRAFSSDQRLAKVLKEGGNADRPDLFVWNVAYGLGVIDPSKNEESVDSSKLLQKVIIVELKRPGRKDYSKTEDNIEAQIVRYLAQLKGREIETFSRNVARLSDDCIFYCYVIADIDGDLRTQLSTWDRTANGEGRIRVLSGDYRGSIEVVQWQDLINDAWDRNQATLFAAGLRKQ